MKNMKLMIFIPKIRSKTLHTTSTASVNAKDAEWIASVVALGGPGSLALNGKGLFSCYTTLCQQTGEERRGEVGKWGVGVVRHGRICIIS